MNKDTGVVLAFPCKGSLRGRLRTMRKAVLNALRTSDGPVIIDLADCQTLTRDDIDLLLECMAQAVGHSTKLILVAGSPAARVLLDVLRVSSIVPVVASLEQAMMLPRRAETVQFKEPGAAPSSLAWSA